MHAPKLAKDVVSQQISASSRDGKCRNAYHAYFARPGLAGGCCPLSLPGGTPPVENIPAGPPLALAPQVDLETALQWTLESNPNLITTRQNLNVSAEAVAVAQHFPTSLNPSVSVTYTPWVFERQANGEVQRPGPVGFGRLGPSRSSWAIGRHIASRWPRPRILRRDGTYCRPSWRP